jgi:hypothetical protein
MNKITKLCIKAVTEQLEQIKCNYSPLTVNDYITVNGTKPYLLEHALNDIIDDIDGNYFNGEYFTIKELASLFELLIDRDEEINDDDGEILDIFINYCCSCMVKEVIEPILIKLVEDVINKPTTSMIGG